MDAASIGVLVLALVIVLALSFVAYWISPCRKRKGEKGEDAGSDKRCATVPPARSRRSPCHAFLRQD